MPGERTPDYAAQQTTLTGHIRALYEGGVVPVREIARLSGVSERTLYKYVQRGGWRRRHATQDIASAVTKRAAKRTPRACVTSRGAGGRFVATAVAGQPFRRGLKALDPEGEARALALARRASALSDEARARTLRLREALSDARTMAVMMGMLRDLAAFEDGSKADTPARKGVAGKNLAHKNLAHKRVAAGRTGRREKSDDELRRELARRIDATFAPEPLRERAGLANLDTPVRGSERSLGRQAPRPRIRGI